MPRMDRTTFMRLDLKTAKILTSDEARDTLLMFRHIGEDPLAIQESFKGLFPKKVAEALGAHFNVDAKGVIWSDFESDDAMRKAIARAQVQYSVDSPSARPAVGPPSRVPAPPLAS